MNAVVSLRRALAPAQCDAALVLIGTGGVGAAFLKLLATPAAAGFSLVGVADSKRQWTGAHGLAPVQAPLRLASATAERDDEALLAALSASGARRRIIVDATASAVIASCHASWLARGFHVVTANKSAIGGDLTAWRVLQDGAREAGTCYGDAATVGAGLPVLSTVRRLRECGDRIRAIEGVFSGSLSWLFTHFDGTVPFSELVRAARAKGYTEPDPRFDLGGIDVARKLLILARAAGFALEQSAVIVQGLVPDELGALDLDAFLARLHELDAPLEAQRADAAHDGKVLRFLARVDAAGQARVGLVAVPADHPATRLGGTDNLFGLTTERYCHRPLVIQGPGAGVEVTAQALLADVGQIAQFSSEMPR